MSLAKLCESISCHETNIISDSDPLFSWIMSPQSSLLNPEIKSYPISKSEPLFALCWSLGTDSHLWASLKPADPPFRCRIPFPPSKCTRLHTHDYLELAYIVSGEFSQKILGKIITFREGELCLIDKNCLHQDILDKSPSTILFFGIANSMFDDIMNSHVAEKRITAFLHSALMKQKNLQQYLHFRPHDDARSDMEASLTQLLLELIRHDLASPHICRGLLMRIFHMLSTRYDFSLSRELRQKMNWILFEEITSYIQQHVKNISIQELSEHFHFQEDYFNRLIKSKTGLTYTSYLQNLRLLKAKELLLHTKQSIDAIAEEVGYQNKGYFYKIFVEKYHITPAHYRKKHLTGE